MKQHVANVSPLASVWISTLFTVLALILSAIWIIIRSDFWSSPDGQTDGQTENDPYESSMQRAQLGTKTLKSHILTSWSWPLTYDLDMWIWLRFYQCAWKHSCLYVKHFGCESADWQTHGNTWLILLTPPLMLEVKVPLRIILIWTFDPKIYWT